jgi:hypothetical protein
VYSVADPHHFDAEADPDLDPVCLFDVDPNPDPTFHFDGSSSYLSL